LQGDLRLKTLPGKTGRRLCFLGSLTEEDLATQAKRDYYAILGVSHTAAEEEIKSAFQKLEAEFHAAGKPKTIDDVEWLRLVVRAYDVLSDGERRRHYDRTGEDSGCITQPPQHGYDPVRLEDMQRAVEQEIRIRRDSRFLGI
jgi:DnaJ-class molecular chaperone